MRALAAPSALLHSNSEGTLDGLYNRRQPVFVKARPCSAEPRFESALANICQGDGITFAAGNLARFVSRLRRGKLIFAFSLL